MKTLHSIGIAILFLIAGLFACPTASAQQYAPGQAVEVDMAGINSWEPGTVVPFLPGDSQDGYLVRVKVPNYSLYPDGMLVQKIHMRPAANAPAQAPNAGAINQAPPPAANNPPPAWQQPAQNPIAPPAINRPANPPAAAAPRGAKQKFNPGDRVEIDKASINSWEGASVIPFEDRDPKDGSMVRIRIDGYTITPHGLLVPVERLRAAGGAAQVVQRNIGDRVDALCTGLWYLATIIDKKGVDEYKVRYDVGGVVNEEWVDPTRLAAPGQGRGARGGPGL